MSNQIRTINSGTKINDLMESDAVQRALKVMSEKLVAADMIIEAASGAAVDIERNPMMRFIEDPDGSRIVEISCNERISVDPR